jgi:hypothetical protein
MAKHRTKDQKRKATEQHRLQADNSGSAIVEMTQFSPKAQVQALPKTTLQWAGGAASHAPKSQTSPESNRLIFGFDPKWVHQDLRKTAVVSALIVGILVFVYFLSF